MFKTFSTNIPFYMLHLNFRTRKWLCGKKHLNSRVSPITRNERDSKQHSSSKMIVLTEFKLLLKYLGLNPWGGFENLFLRAIYLMTFISFQIMFWTFFFSNINGHVYRALGSLPAVLACASNMVCYFHVLINGKRFSSLLNELQSIVTES